MDNVENKIFVILDMIGDKMAPVIQKFLVEGCSLVAYAGRTIDSLIEYLDKNLIQLKDELNGSNFDRVLTVIWESSAHSLHETISLSIERHKPPSYFKVHYISKAIYSSISVSICSFFSNCDNSISREKSSDMRAN